MNTHKNFQTKKLLGYFTEKKEKRGGIIRKFFELFQFKDDEVYY
jgi:hypothetical protein